MKAILLHIILPILVAFIIFCITPFFAKFRNKMIIFFGKISKSFSRSIYKKASFGNLTGPLSALIHIVLLIIVFIYSASYSYFYSYVKFDYESVKNETVYKLMKENDALKDFDTFNEKLNELLIEQNEKEEKSLLTFLGIFLLSTYIYFYVIWSRAEAVNFLIIGFNRDLNIIRPNISEKEFLEIKRSWALMKSRDDWNKINDLIELKKTEINNNA